MHHGGFYPLSFYMSIMHDVLHSLSVHVYSSSAQCYMSKYTIKGISYIPYRVYKCHPLWRRVVCLPPFPHLCLNTSKRREQTRVSPKTLMLYYTLPTWNKGEKKKGGMYFVYRRRHHIYIDFLPVSPFPHMNISCRAKSAGISRKRENPRRCDSFNSKRKSDESHQKKKNINLGLKIFHVVFFIAKWKENKKNVSKWKGGIRQGKYYYMDHHLHHHRLSLISLWFPDFVVRPHLHIGWHVVPHVQK